VAEPVRTHCSIEAMNYRLLNASTRIEFQGTALLPAATGKAKVKTREGISTIKAKFEHLPAASTFGEACLTYVLWAVSPEGQTANLGELQVKKGTSKVMATEQMPAFGLMVTAEPYFAVTRPSDAVVLKNTLGKDTKVKVELVEAKLELVPIRQYAMNLAAAPVATEPQTDLSMQQAHQAVRIAQGAGAATYAKDALARATDYLQQTQPGQGDVKGRAMAARSATQSAEEARVLAERGQRMELEASARKLTEEKLEQARQEAAQATLAKEQAVTQAKLAENDNETLRAQLMEQFNGILETKATARGLIVSMSGELFRTGQSTLEPEAREKLAKVAGILATHKGLRIEADGFTDSTGTAAINERLSASRAQAARDFLVSQGVPADAIVTRGLGAEHPVAGNDSAEGRQENRRVELVVSGEGLTDAPASH
jgi:outer membrane protein OmpA-like peptidoglycan-associated protein